MDMHVEQAAAVGDALRRRGWTLAVGESCTGGMLGAAFTETPGSSRYFRGGAIAYANDVKERVLGVGADVIARHGAVSVETAQAMARGAARMFGADVGVGVTGIAGPDGGTEFKPVGAVYVAVARAQTAAVREFRFAGNRAAVRAAAVRAAMDLVRECVELWG